MPDEEPGHITLTQMITEILQLNSIAQAAALIVNEAARVLAVNQVCEHDLDIHANDVIEWKRVSENRLEKRGILHLAGKRTSRQLDVSYLQLESFKEPLFLLYVDTEKKLKAGYDPAFSMYEENLHTIIPGVAFRCINDRSWTMEYLDERFFNLTGYPPEDVIANRKFSYMDLVYEEDRDRIWSDVQAALKEEKAYQLLYRIVKADGNIQWIQEQGRGISGNLGEPERIEGWIIDFSHYKEVADALIESETRYLDLIQACPDSVTLVDAKGIVVSANQQFARMLDAVDVNEITGKKLTKWLVFESKKQSLANILENLTHDDIYCKKHICQSLIGRKFPVEVSLRAILQNNQTSGIYIGVVRDISVQERTLQDLRASAAYYRAIVEDNPEMIVRYMPDGTVTFANLAYANFYGIQRNDLLGANLKEKVPASSKQTIQNILDYITPDMVPAVKEHSLKQKNGNIRWYRWKTMAIRDDTGNFIEYQSIGEDITNQKNAEEDSRQFERKLQDLMENIKLAALIVDPNGVIKFCNSYYLELTGQKNKSLIESNWLDGHVPADEALRLRRKLFEPALEGKIPQQLDSQILTIKGDQRLIAWNNTLIRNNTGDVIAIALIGEDITEKRMAEKTQEAIYKISQSAIETVDLDGLYSSIHKVLMELMPAENFFIALFDRIANSLSFPYYKDQFDAQPPPEPLGRGLTEYVLRTGKTLLANPEVFNLLVEEGEVISVGAPSVDWLGAPLKVRDKVIGVMVAQTYSEEVRLRKRDEQMFNFVSSQVAMAIERKQAEQALRLSQRRNELLVQASTDGIVLATLEGDILDCNQVFQDMYGYSQKELLQMKISDLIPKDFLVNRTDFVAWELSQGGFVPEIPNLRKDGSVFPAEVSTRLAAIEQAQFLVTYVRDVTERKKSEQAIVESEAKFRALAETAAAGIFIHRGGKNLYVNPTLCQISGYSEEELLKKKYWEIVVPESVDLAKEQYLTLSNGGVSQKRYEVAILNRSGEKKWLEIIAGLIDYEGEQSFISTAVDISNRKQREHELEVVAKISEALRATLSREEVHKVILQEMMNLFDIDGAVISTMLEGDDTRLEERAIGSWSQLNGTTIKINEGLSGHIVVTAKSYINNHASHDPYFSIPELVQTLTSLVGVPLIAKGGTIGALVIGSAHVLSESDMRLLSAIGNLAAGAVHRSDLHDQTLRQAQELKSAYDATLEGWAVALEMRDKETQGHSLRIANMTLRLAKRLGYRNEDLENVRRGALLHDIGKMGIPDTILLKPNKLNVEEWAIMQKHPEYAHEMLSQQLYYKHTLDIPYCHHEWWDGTGYPRGLRGKEIPLVARIFSIVDAWDALTSDRPYRKAWDKKEALAHIIDQSGTHYDPEVVIAFTQMLKEEGL